MKVLILEDNMVLAQSLQEIIQSEGGGVKICNSYKEADRELNKELFDLLVLDYLLPDKKGFEVLNALSFKKQHLTMKIAIISGFVDPALVLQNTPDKFKNQTTFFKKPIDEKKLIEFLQEIKTTESNHHEKAFFEKDSLENPLSFYLPRDQVFTSGKLISIVFIAYLKQFTGELKLKRDNNITYIRFYEGSIVQITGNDKKSFLGNLLIEYGLSFSKDISDSLKTKDPDHLLGKKLLEKELLNPYMLNLMLKEQIRIRLSEVMSYPSFTVEILEKENQFSANRVIFDEIDLMEWLAGSVQTELTDDFFKKFYLEFQTCLVYKAKPVRKNFIQQAQFLKKYNLWFENFKDGTTLSALIHHPVNPLIGPILYFGLCSKSLYLQKEKSSESKHLEHLLDSIIEQDSKDLFAVLKLPWAAEPSAVEKSYKQLIQKVHPDLLPSSVSQELRDKANKALSCVFKSYQTLRDEKKREKYIKSQKEHSVMFVMNKYNEGINKIKKEQYEKGVNILLKITNNEYSPRDTCLYILWGRIKSMSFDEAEKQEEAVKLKKAIDFCPASLKITPLFWFVKGLFFVKTEQYEKAEEFFNKSLTAKEDFFAVKKELIFVRQKIKSSQAKKSENKWLNFLFKKSS